MKRPAALPADLPYRGVIGLAKTGFRALGQRLRIEGSADVTTVRVALELLLG